MTKEEAKEAAKTAAHEEAMTRFRIGGEDLTPVIQAARLGFEAGFEFASKHGRAIKKSVNQEVN